jgi:hypothetical protein
MEIILPINTGQAFIVPMKRTPNLTVKSILGNVMVIAQIARHIMDIGTVGGIMDMTI